MLALSGSARSNGALNSGYFCFQALLQSYDAAVKKKRPLVRSTSVVIVNINTRHECTERHHIALNYLFIFCFHKMQSSKTCLYLISLLSFIGQLVVQALVAAALRSIFIFVPFFAFQAYGYFNICVHGSSGELRPWCKAKVPLLYGFIQSHYW